MPPRGRHRRPPPGPKAAGGAGGNDITGKRASQAKNQRYARPLPVDVVTPIHGKQKAKQPTTWAQWFAAWLPGLTSDAAASSAHVKDEQDDLLVGYLDPSTLSVWVQVTPPHLLKAGPASLESQARIASQTRAARILWDAGFFGKGSLSRSEPTWRARKINEERVKLQRERGIKAYTPEELIAARRKERLHAKIERARLAVKAGQQLPDGIVALGGTLSLEEEKILAARAEKEMQEEGDDGKEVEEEYGKHIPGLIYLGPKKDEEVQRDLTPQEKKRLEEEEANIEIEDMEYLHLSPYEVFFLAGMLGVLDVRTQQDDSISLSSLYKQLLASHLPLPIRTLTPSSTLARPDNPYLLSYLVYHHYRSLGWSVKSGIKFCADFLLYKRGPVFGHAEFAVVVVPVYEDKEDEASSPFPKHPAGGDRDWVWFSTMNRVQTQVLKTLVLAHVTIPSVKRLEKEGMGDALCTPEGLVQGLKDGKLHSVTEVSLRRWVPARMRG